MFRKPGEQIAFRVGDIYFTGVVKHVYYSGNTSGEFEYLVEAHQDGLVVTATVSGLQVEEDSATGARYYASNIRDAHIEAEK
jgi:hypothetical protein